jgi:hypothetical protein
MMLPQAHGKAQQRRTPVAAACVTFRSWLLACSSLLAAPLTCCCCSSHLLLLLLLLRLQVNLALKGLPRFRCLPEARGQHRTTAHLLPDKHRMLTALGCCCCHCLCLHSAVASQVNLALTRTATHLLPAWHAAQRAWQVSVSVQD